MALVAAAPLVIVHDASNRAHYAYEGDVITVDIAPDRRKDLLKTGMVREVKAASQVSASSPSQGVPTKSATADVWRAHALALGIEVEGLTKPQIIEAVEALAAAPDDDGKGDSAEEGEGGQADEAPVNPDAPTVN